MKYVQQRSTGLSGKEHDRSIEYLAHIFIEEGLSRILSIIYVTAFATGLWSSVLLQKSISQWYIIDVAEVIRSISRCAFSSP